ncbi:LuxR family transcriptional regulator [Roseovarius faecimaris]|uniref:LuxR family transcriptional regulator n=1 Tax=Roseovarius faecimaris TaxID=2494550 RepID=A0A6I6IRG0_9RHOB|nr:autoinducer binding domain-containing protein [Roseovarius faecimaris]QGX98471.1 LuxR family transcriptional regulator [Roseovarius faecimaris]
MELIDLAATPQGRHDFVDYLNQICGALELDYASYASANPVSGKVVAFTTYPDRWRDHYMQQNLHLSDPTLHTASRSIAPVDWSRLDHTEAFTNIFDQASDFGLPDKGLTVPVRGPFGETGLFSVTSSASGACWAKLKKNIIADLQLSAVYMHDRVMKSDRLLDILQYPALSAREIEILQWVAVGKTQQDVADILGISARTVEVHLRSSREKLSTITTPQAVGRAVSIGLIYPG